MSFLERRVETTAEFGAPAHEVWAVLTDFPAYGEWNPFMVEISGQLAEGDQLEVAFKQQSGKLMRFRPRVLRVSPARQIRWLGRLGPGGLFDGEHYFVLEPTEDGSTRMVHGERFTGLLVPLMKKMIAETAESFEAMNEALGERLAERE